MLKKEKTMQHMVTLLFDIESINAKLILPFHVVKIFSKKIMSK